MNEEELFLSFINDLGTYLKTEKVFIKNPIRCAEIMQAKRIADELFGDMEVTIQHDPLQMGSLVLTIKGFDITARGQREIKLFQDLISKSDNFEIYSIGNEEIKFALMFNKALTRISN